MQIIEEFAYVGAGRVYLLTDRKGKVIVVCKHRYNITEFMILWVISELYYMKKYQISAVIYKLVPPNNTVCHLFYLCFILLLLFVNYKQTGSMINWSCSSKNQGYHCIQIKLLFYNNEIITNILTTKSTLLIRWAASTAAVPEMVLVFPKNKHYHSQEPPLHSTAIGYIIQKSEIRSLLKYSFHAGTCLIRVWHILLHGPHTRICNCTGDS